MRSQILTFVSDKKGVGLYTNATARTPEEFISRVAAYLNRTCPLEAKKDTICLKTFFGVTYSVTHRALLGFALEINVYLVGILSYVSDYETEYRIFDSYVEL